VRSFRTVDYIAGTPPYWYIGAANVVYLEWILFVHLGSRSHDAT
jgi:hypothetical protein